MSFPRTPLRLLPAVEPEPPVPPAPPTAVNLIRALVEAVMGRRALHQIRPYLSQAAFERLAAYTDTGRFRHVRLASLRTQMPLPGAVEASVRVEHAGRSLTCVLRLDALEGAWRCTEFTVLAPRRLLAA